MEIKNMNNSIIINGSGNKINQKNTTNNNIFIDWKLLEKEYDACLYKLDTENKLKESILKKSIVDFKKTIATYVCGLGQEVLKELSVSALVEIIKMFIA